MGGAYYGADRRPPPDLFALAGLFDAVAIICFSTSCDGHAEAWTGSGVHNLFRSGSVKDERRLSLEARFQEASTRQPARTDRRRMFTRDHQRLSMSDLFAHPEREPAV